MADVEETTQEKDLPQSNIDFEWWWTHVITPIFSWLGDVISSLFPWVLFLLFFLSKDVRISLKALFKRIGDANEFQIGGMRFNLTNQEFDHYYDAYSKRRRQKLMQIYDILVVTSRKVVWLFFEQLRLEFVPVFHHLQGRFAA